MDNTPLQSQPSLLTLPPELVVDIFEYCTSLKELTTLSLTCKHLHGIFTEAACHLYDVVLRRTLPACDDAIRLQRASLSAILHMRHVGLNDDHALDPLLPPDGISACFSLPVCRFDTDQDVFVDVPTEADIIQLGAAQISSVWEAKRVVEIHAIVSYYRDTIFAEFRSCLWHWFETLQNLREFQSDLWTAIEEERFFRGAYRYWLYCSLFYPGCYFEPFFIEQEKLRGAVDEDYRKFRGVENPDDMAHYPLFKPSVDITSRRPRLEPLFDGFNAWLVHDGEQRGEHEFANRRLRKDYYPPPPPAWDKYGKPPAAHGGMRELLLIHAMHHFLRSLDVMEAEGMFATRDNSHSSLMHIRGYSCHEAAIRGSRLVSKTHFQAMGARET